MIFYGYIVEAMTVKTMFGSNILYGYIYIQLMEEGIKWLILDSLCPPGFMGPCIRHLCNYCYSSTFNCELFIVLLICGSQGNNKKEFVSVFLWDIRDERASHGQKNGYNIGLTLHFAHRLLCMCLVCEDIWIRIYRLPYI